MARQVSVSSHFNKIPYRFENTPAAHRNCRKCICVKPDKAEQKDMRTNTSCHDKK